MTEYRCGQHGTILVLEQEVPYYDVEPPYWKCPTPGCTVVVKESV